MICLLPEYFEIQNLKMVGCDQKEKTRSVQFPVDAAMAHWPRKRTARVKDRVNLNAEKWKLENEIFCVAQLQYPRLY